MPYFSILIIATCAIFFYRAAEFEDESTLIWCGLSVTISVATFFWLHWSWLGIILGQVALYVGITLFGFCESPENFTDFLTDSLWHLQLHLRRHLRHVFVAATGEVHDDQFVFAHFRRAHHALGDGVRAFERGNNSFESRQFHERFERFFIRRVGVFHAAGVAQERVFRPDGGVIESGADAVRGLDLAKFVLQNKTARALQHAERAALKPRRMLFRLDAASARFHADHPHGFVFEERIKKSDGVRAAADAGDEQVGQALFLFQNLRARLVADDALEIPHHHRIRMCAVSRAENVVRATDIRDPVAHRLVDGFLQSFLSRVHRHDFRAEHFHAINIEDLPFAIHRTHVDDAFHPEHRAHRSRGDAVPV